MKTKKHYNSFHPKHGFFLHVDQVLSWFEAEVRPMPCPYTDYDDMSLDVKTFAD